MDEPAALGVGPPALKRGLEPCLENVVSSYYVASAFPDLLDRKSVV